jgi:ADP-ribose pyrophosphatase YjhB (NUDIX family)
MSIRLTAAAVIEQKGRILLVEEKANGRVVLNTPSGRFEAGDKSLAETAIREAAEEAGVTFTPEFHLGTYVTTHTTLNGQRICTVRFAFGGCISRSYAKSRATRASSGHTGSPSTKYLIAVSAIEAAPPQCGASKTTELDAGIRSMSWATWFATCDALRSEW